MYGLNSVTFIPPAHLSRGTRPVRGPWDQASAGVEVGVLVILSFEWYNMKPGGEGSADEPKNAELLLQNIRAKD